MIDQVGAGRPAGAEKIGLAAGKLIDKYRMAKHVTVATADARLAVTRRGRADRGRCDRSAGHLSKPRVHHARLTCDTSNAGSVDAASPCDGC